MSRFRIFLIILGIVGFSIGVMLDLTIKIPQPKKIEAIESRVDKIELSLVKQIKSHVQLQDAVILLLEKEAAKMKEVEE